jgi:hypothetical protein
MRSRLGFLFGLGAGYVLGTKAGRERYEQLRRLYENVKASPAFQHATGRAKDAVGSSLGQAKEKAAEGVSKIKSRSDDGQHGLSVAPPPSSS